MPFVQVCVAGTLTREQKSNIAKDISKSLQNHASKSPDSIYIVFEEVAKENWAKGPELLG